MASEAAPQTDKMACGTTRLPRSEVRAANAASLCGRGRRIVALATVPVSWSVLWGAHRPRPAP